MSAVILAVTGILFLMVPHFILPIDLISGGRGAQILTECSFFYHPESLCGILLIIAAIMKLKGKKGNIMALAAVAAGLIQAALMRPVSFYLQSEEGLVIIGQTYSLRAHAHLAETITILSLLALATIIGEALIARRKRRTISLMNLSVSNIRRKIFRSTALVVALSVVIGAFFADVLLTRSISKTLELGAGRLGADLVLVPKTAEKEARDVLVNGTPHIFNLKKGILEQLEKWPEIEKISPQLFFKPFSYLVCCTTEQILIIGYDPETDFTIGPWVNYFLKQESRDDEVVVGARVKFYPGQKISLFGKLITVVASLDHTGLGYFDRSAFIPMEGARQLIRFLKKREQNNHLHKRRNIDDMSLDHLYDSSRTQEKQLGIVDPDSISAIMIKCRDDVAVKELAGRIRKQFPSLAVINVRSATITVKRQLTSMLNGMFMPIVILMLMGAVILAVVFSMSANERKREVGLLRAMGATRHDVFNVFLGEAVMISILGGVFGVLEGGSLLILFKNRIMASLDLLYIWPEASTAIQVIIITLAVSIAIGIIAGIFPALKAARQEPYEAFRSS